MRGAAQTRRQDSAPASHQPSPPAGRGSHRTSSSAFFTAQRRVTRLLRDRIDDELRSARASARPSVAHITARPPASRKRLRGASPHRHAIPPERQVHRLQVLLGLPCRRNNRSPSARRQRRVRSGARRLSALRTSSISLARRRYRFVLRRFRLVERERHRDQRRRLVTPVHRFFSRATSSALVQLLRRDLRCAEAARSPRPARCARSVSG